MKKLFIPLMVMGMVVFADVTYAAFGSSRSSSGVSRSYSRPATSSSFSKPSTTYKTQSPPYRNPSVAPTSAPTYNYSGNSSSRSNNSYRNNSNTGSYNNQGYAPRQNSAMRDIGVTAAGVGGGILAAQAISSLISSPHNPGMYTHPQYPGQYFNQQGQQVAPPSQAAPQQTQIDYAPTYRQQPQQPVVIVQQQAPASDSGFTFFGFLWGSLWFLIKLAFFLSVIVAIGLGVYKLVQMSRNKAVREKVQVKIQEKFMPQGPSEFDDLDGKAMDIFYDFQANSNDETWVKANTKYLPVMDCLSPPSKVLRYEHRTTDCVVEQGKVRGSVHYRATVDDGTGEIEVSQYWNFEKDDGKWKLIGFESE